jgi:hypothetical protein
VAGALIMTAMLSPPDFARFDGLRRRHYPPDRNQVPAHLTIFHAVPPSAEAEARRALSAAASAPEPRATVAGLINLGEGVAFRVVSDELDDIREQLAERLHGLLGPQDAGGWRPHITVQNKVPAREARALMEQLQQDFAPRPLRIVGLQLQRYLGGPWQELGRWRFGSR